MSIQIIDPATVDAAKIKEDSQAIHRWSEQLIKCPVTMGDLSDKHAHYHYMKCGDCGTQRFGAYAEQGAYHYFTYEHGYEYYSVHIGKTEKLRHELIPPCTRALGKAYELRVAKICSRCRHICNRQGLCDYRCNAPIFEISAVARRHSHKPHPLSDFVLG